MYKIDGRLKMKLIKTYTVQLINVRFKYNNKVHD